MTWHTAITIGISVLAGIISIASICINRKTMKQIDKFEKELTGKDCNDT